MAYTLKGKLLEVFDVIQISEKFQKREFVVEVQDGQYAEQIKLQLTGTKTDLIDPYAPGQEIEVSFNLRGKGYNKNGQTMYFTSLDCWKIQPLGQAPVAAKVTQDDSSDLPF